MNKDVKRGINGGLICFAILLIPYLIYAFLFFSVDLGAFRDDNVISFYVGIVVFAIVSSFSGLGIARNSKTIKIISMLLIVLIIITWISLFIYFNFI